MGRAEGVNEDLIPVKSLLQGYHPYDLHKKQSVPAKVTNEKAPDRDAGHRISEWGCTNTQIRSGNQ